MRHVLTEVALVTCVDDPERAGACCHYQHFCFKVYVRFAATSFETRYCGIVDWTQRLVGSARERCFINGIGIGRLALVVRAP